MTTINISENIYFRNIDIINDLEYSTTMDFSSPIIIRNCPVTFINNTPLNINVFFTNDLVVYASTHFFIIGSDNITIDFLNNKVLIDGVINYRGLIQNGTENTFGRNNIIIQNIRVCMCTPSQPRLMKHTGHDHTVSSITSTLAPEAGWIGQRNMNMNALGCVIKNCDSDGVISHKGGGIVGSSSDGIVENCHSTGPISESGSGGIFGSHARGTAKNCYSTGVISGLESGGIFGVNSSATATNCYSASVISGEYAGGIFGSNSTGIATNCYSANGNWNDQTAVANGKLIYGPSYLIDGQLINQGAVWIDISLSANNVPFRLNNFNQYNSDNITSPLGTGKSHSGIITKIANLNFNKNIEFLHVAMEPIIAYSVVFGVSDGNITKVYTSQNATFANGTPWVMGIAQNNAQIGETVQVQYFGLSKVRFFSRNVPANQFIYLLNNSDGVCCLYNEAGIDTFKRSGKSIMIGNVLPRTQPVMGSTLEPRHMLVDCYIHIESRAEAEAVQETVFQLNYRIYYNERPMSPYNLIIIASSPPSNFVLSYKRQIKDNENTPIGVGTYQFEIYYVQINEDKKTGEMIGDFTAHHEFGKQGINYDIFLNGNSRWILGLRPGQIEIDPSKPYEYIVGNQLDNIAATSVYKDRVKINYGNNSVRLTNGYQYTIKGVVSSNSFEILTPLWAFA